jgi:hypothetical protein
VNLDPLTAPLEAAFALPDVYDGLKPVLGKDPMLGGLEFPDVTLHKFEMQARLQLRAGVRLLEDEWLAYAAESHVRGLLECLAHVSYIAAGTKQNPATRALCVEVGIAKAMQDLILKLPDEAVPNANEARPAVERDLADIRERHAHAGCRCSGRGSGHVAPMLKELAKIGSPFTTLAGAYEASSTFIHQALVQRLIAEVAPGVSDAVPCSDQQRGSYLTWLVAAYQSVVTQILYLDSADAGSKFNVACMEVIRHPDLRAALGAG